MRVKEPYWWYRGRGSLPGTILAPIGAIWGRVADYRYRRKQPYCSSLPVICVGNFTVGGTGKTPVALAIAAMLREMNEKPAFLTRGYGGRFAGPHWVDPAKDSAQDVGDEPLLLAQMAPVMIARDRAIGAQAMEQCASKISAIIMDDGLQNGSLQKNLTIAVVDRSRGIGNRRVVPAGPLRSSFERQLERVDIVVRNGLVATSTGSVACPLERTFTPGIVEIEATTEPAADVGWLSGTRIVAFTGIGSPQRFFDLLSSLGAQIVHAETFPDHHQFRQFEATQLLLTAQSLGADLVTTEKDRVRMSRLEGAISELFHRSKVVPIVIKFAAEDQRTLRARLRCAIVNGSPASSTKCVGVPGSA